MDLERKDFKLTNLGECNVVVGRNGCGKSWLLRKVADRMRHETPDGAVKYISPERGGFPRYDAGIEANLNRQSNWLLDSRGHNQVQDFKVQSAAQFGRLQRLHHLAMEANIKSGMAPGPTFDGVVERINSLLDRVRLVRADMAFDIRLREAERMLGPDEVSSGETELISLAIECLAFNYECKAGEQNLLLIDEPDVHLHPDLQARLADFLADIISEGKVTIIIATHSAPLLAALSCAVDTHVCFMRIGQSGPYHFEKFDEIHRAILPVFGAHPLSQVFNERPVLFVEGEDDVRIWQQAVRSSEGAIAVYPVATQSKDHMNAYEERTSSVLSAIYDQPLAYSLRDRDDTPGELPPMHAVRRMRLGWRAAENLLLTDEVLAECDTTWDALKIRIADWLEQPAGHPHYDAMKEFADGGFQRSSAKLKIIRNDLVGLMGSNAPWEVLVGQAIAGLAGTPTNLSGTSLWAALGEATVLLRSDAAPSQ